MTLQKFLERLDVVIWDNFLIYLLVGTGIFLTIYLRGIQFRYLFLSLKLAFSTKHDSNAKGDISQFQSLMTSLAATIGIGSIAGMATAITAGGYGAIFWMWVVALIGMITKYSEAILAVKYRKSDSKGRMKGGPMYYIEQGLKMKWLAVLFAVFGLLSSFAGGNLIQAQSIADASLELFNIPPIVTGIIVAVCVAATLFGGVKKLGKINSFLVPIMALLYIVGGLIVLVLCHDKILDAISLIFSNAFSGRSVTGGLLGAGVMSSVQMGVARGISSNEAGLGSGPIASAAAKTDYPGRQALISMSAVFISSFIVCTITVLVLSVTNMVGKVSDNGQILNGAPLVMQSFESVLPGGGVIVALGLLLFGFSTILGWSYYGEKCMEFLFNGKGIVLFRLIFICLVFVGSLLSINVVWPLADIMNGLMAFPNLIGVLFLAKVVSKESDSFFRLLRTERKVIQSYE